MSIKWLLVHFGLRICSPYLGEPGIHELVWQDITSAGALVVAIVVFLNGYLRKPSFVRAIKLDELESTIRALHARCEVLEAARDDAERKNIRCEQRLEEVRDELDAMRRRWFRDGPTAPRTRDSDE